jgi:hypothetical protein
MGFYNTKVKETGILFDAAVNSGDEEISGVGA